MRDQSRGEERASRGDVTAARDEHVDDLTIFIHSPSHVAPDAGDFDVSLVDEPPHADRVPTRSCRVNQRWREAMHPTEQGDVIDLDAVLREEFLEIAIRQTEPQTPADRQRDRLSREPESRERRQIEGIG